MNNGLIIVEEISPVEEIIDESISVEEIEENELNIIEAGKFELNSLDFVPTIGELSYTDNTAKFTGEFKYTTVRKPEEVLTASGSISFKIHGHDGIVVDTDEENNSVEVHLDGDVIKYLEDSNISINTLKVDLKKLQDFVNTIPFSKSFSDIHALVNALNGAKIDEYNVGSNLYVRTLQVPDFWVFSREETSIPYTYTTDEDFINAIKSNGGALQIGYYKVSLLETEKVDLSDYYTKTESDAITDELQREILKVDGILAETNYEVKQNTADIESLEMKNADINEYIEDLQTRVGDIEEFGLTTNTPQIIKKEGVKIFESVFGISSSNGADVIRISNYGTALSFLDSDGESMWYLDRNKKTASAFGKELMTKEDFVAQHGTKVFVNNEFQETFDADTKADKTEVEGIVKSLDNYVLKTKTVDDNTSTIMNNGTTVSMGVQDLDGGSVLGLSSNSLQLSISENEDESHILMTPDHIDIDSKALTHNGENILVDSDLNDYATKEYVAINGGKIDSISVNGTKQTIDENKNVDLKVVETETDPTVPDYVKSITEQDITNWNDKAEIADLPTNYVTTDTTQTINASKTIVGDLTIQGNITQTGSNYITHAEKVYTTNDYIIMRDGATGGLGDGYSGFQVKLYNGVDDGRLVIDSDGIARVGDVGDEQPLATREETPLDGGFAKWDGTNKKFVTNTISSSDLTDKSSLATTLELDTVKSNVTKNASDISTIQNNVTTIQGDISDIDQDIINTNAKFKDYLPLAGGIVTGNIISTADITAQTATLGSAKLMGSVTSQEEDYVVVTDTAGNMHKRAMNKVLDDIGGSTILDEGVRVDTIEISEYAKKSEIKSETIYDLVIKTQEEFEAWYHTLDDGTCTAHSVLLVGDGGTLEFVREDGGALHLPETLYTLEGINNAIIRVDNHFFTVPLNEEDIETASYTGCINYHGISFSDIQQSSRLSEIPSFISDNTKYTMKNIHFKTNTRMIEEEYKMSIGVTGCYNIINCTCSNTVMAFIGCYRLINCNSNGTLGFLLCENLVNCSSTVDDSGANYNNCYDLVNCSAKNNGPVEGPSAVNEAPCFNACENMTNCSGQSNANCYFECKKMSNCSAESADKYGFYDCSYNIVPTGSGNLGLIYNGGYEGDGRGNIIYDKSTNTFEI